MNPSTSKQHRKHRRLLLLPLILLLAAGLACSFSVDLTPEPEVTETPAPSETPEAAAASEDGAVEEAAQNVFIVLVTQDLNVRSGPSVNCPVIGVFPQNAQVPVQALTTDGSWWKVQVGANEVGWMATSYTSPLTNLSSIPTEDGLACAAATSTASGPAATATLPAPTESGVVATATATATLAPPTATSTLGLIPLFTLPPLATLPGIQITLNPCVITGTCPTATPGFLLPPLEPIITLNPCVLTGTCP